MRTPQTHARTIALAALLACAGSASALDDTIVWRSDAAQRLAPVRLAPAQAADHAVRIAAQPGAPRMILQFDTAPTKAQRTSLAAEGVTLLAPLGSGAYFARLSPGVDANALTAAGLVGASPIRLEHKLHDNLLDMAPPSWSVVDARNQGPLSDPTVGVYVRFHDDVDAVLAEANTVIADHAGVVRDTLTSVNAMVVELPLSQVSKLAEDDRVQWIEPPLPRMEHYNASNRAITQVDVAQAAPYSLDGSGVTVLVYDGGTARATHGDLTGRTTVIDSSGTHYHATHVAGTVGGNGSGNATHTGMAPGANVISAGFEYDGSGTFLYTNPGDIEADYSTAINSHAASISNNSIGSNVGPNGFPCSYEGDYGLCAATIDNIIRGSLGGPIVIFWSAGNERGWACGSTYNTSPPPTNNKNAITVGALNSNDDSMTSFSSWGPSDDGRIRPVLAGPGCQSNGDGGVTSCDSGHDTDYTTLCGTSMSGPTLAGMGALIFEDFRNTFPSEPDPSNQLMKSWLCHTTLDLGATGPDYQFGYGSAKVVNTIDFVRSGDWGEGVVDQGGNVSYTINVNPGDPELKATLAWDDPAGTPNVGNALVNDLDLVVISPSGTRHFPWTLNPASPASPAVQTQEDHLNNIEQVQVSSPEPGAWRVEVRGFNVADGPQTFALSATPDLGDGLLAASVTTTVPTLHPPATPLPVGVTVFPGIDSLVPGSVTLSYRYDAGAFTTVAMPNAGGDNYASSIPGADCGESIEFYVSAEGAIVGPIDIPSAGPAAPYAVSIGEISVLLDDNFETDTGWTVSGGVATQATGRWERGVPAGGGSRGDPAADADGSGQCWLTGNAAGNTDVDNASTILTSSDYALASAPEAVISYRRWYDTSVGSSSDDFFVVDISNNGGASWTNLETVGPNGSGSWIEASFRVADFVTPTDQVRLRFTASDLGTQNVVEAGVDAIHIESFVCEGPASCNAADLAEPFGSLDFSDVSAFLTAFATSQPEADLAAPFGQWDFSDVSAYLTIFAAGCP